MTTQVPVNMVSHMKTTIEIPEGLYREVKAHAVASRRTLKVLLEQALREKLARERLEGQQSGWRAAFGKVRPGTIRALQRDVEEEFEKIDPETWR